jgi:hypothetical protein
VNRSGFTNTACLTRAAEPDAAGLGGRHKGGSPSGPLDLTHGGVRTLNAATITEDQNSGQLLLAWLSLIGWQTSISRDTAIEAVAEHVSSDGRRMLVEAHGTSMGDVALELFERALGKLELNRRIEHRPATAHAA